MELKKLGLKGNVQADPVWGQHSVGTTVCLCVCGKNPALRALDGGRKPSALVNRRSHPPEHLNLQHSTCAQPGPYRQRFAYDFNAKRCQVLSSERYTHTQTHTHARSHARTHAHTQTRMHAGRRAHTRTHAQTHALYSIGSEHSVCSRSYPGHTRSSGPVECIHSFCQRASAYTG